MSLIFIVVLLILLEFLGEESELLENTNFSRYPVNEVLVTFY